MVNKLSLNSISACFGKHAVFQNLSGAFRSGKPNLIVGRAGSGKSTLLQVISGFHPLKSGFISLDDEPFVPVGNFSLVFQNPETLFFNATVLEEVSFALKMRGVTDPELTESSRFWLKKWGLDPDLYCKKHPLELSGGEKRRLALAACTVFMPPVILLDEPLAGLDSFGQSALADLLAEFAADHIVITVTHEPEIFLGNCNAILFLHDNGCSWFDTAEFIKAALCHNDFYPLPLWYQEAMQPFKEGEHFPPINAAAVFAFFQEKGFPNADKL